VDSGQFSSGKKQIVGGAFVVFTAVGRQEQVPGAVWTAWTDGAFRCLQLVAIHTLCSKEVVGLMP
jgi:hypothetical protein